MSRALIALVLGCALLGLSTTRAEQTAGAIIEAECTGRMGAQVAVRMHSERNSARILARYGIPAASDSEEVIVRARSSHWETVTHLSQGHFR